MKKFALGLLALLALPVLAQSTTPVPVVGNINSISGVAAGANNYLEFTLVNCGANQPTVNGVAVMLNSPVDFYPGTTAGTLVLQDGVTPAALYGNDIIACGNLGNTSRYSEQQFVNGQPAGPAKYYFVQSGTGLSFNINTATPIYVLPPLKYPNPTSCGAGYYQTGLNNDLSVQCTALPPSAANAVIVNPAGTQIVQQPSGSQIQVNGGLAATQTNTVFHTYADVQLNPNGCLGVTTPLECTVAKANAWASANSGIAIVHIDSGSYTISHALVLAVTGSSRVVLSGDGNAQSQITYAGAAITTPVISQASGSFVRGTFSDFRLDVGGLAPYGISSANGYTDLHNIIVTGATSANFQLSGNTINAANLASFVNGSYSQGSGALFIPTVSGGQLTGLTPASAASTVTVNSGGSGYTSPAASFSGGGCVVYPTGSLQTSGTSPNLVITGFSLTIRGLCTSAPTLTVNDSTGAGASLTVAMTAQGGSGYTSPAVNFYGYGATPADQPCTTLPTATLNLSGGVVTGAVITNAGAGCVSTISASVNDAPTLAYDFDLSATDSTFTGLYASAGQTAGIYNHGDGNTFVHYHPYYIPTGFLNTAGATKLFGLECDSIRHYCIDTNFYVEAHGTSQVWDGNGPYPGASFMHFSASGANSTSVDGLTCSNTQNGGLYSTLVTTGFGSYDAVNAIFPFNGSYIADCTPSGTQPTGNPEQPTRTYDSLQNYFNNATYYRPQGVATSSANYQSQVDNMQFNVYGGNNPYTVYRQFVPTLSGPYGAALQYVFPSMDANITSEEVDWINPTPGTSSSTNCGPGLKSLYSEYNGTGSSQRYGMWRPCIHTAGTSTDDYMELDWNSTSSFRHLYFDVFTFLDWDGDTTLGRSGGGVICAGTAVGSTADCNGKFRARYLDVWNNSNSTYFEQIFSGTSNFTATWPNVSGGVQVDAETDITWSATPTLNPIYSLNTIGLTGNTAPTIASGTAGQCFILDAAENATGGYTWTWPSNIVLSSQAVAFATTANAMNAYNICWNNSISKWVAK